MNPPAPVTHTVCLAAAAAMPSDFRLPHPHTPLRCGARFGRTAPSRLWPPIRFWEKKKVDIASLIMGNKFVLNIRKRGE